MPKGCTVRRSYTGHRIGESHPRAQLSSDDVRLVRILHEEHHIGFGTIGKKFETPRATIQSLCRKDEDGGYIIRSYE